MPQLSAALRLLILCLPLLAAPPGAAAGDAAYRYRNVAIGGGGFVTGIEFHPRQAGLFYARTDIGGAWRRDGDTPLWQPLTDWIGHDDANLMGIESLAIDPSDPDRLYLAAGTYTRTGAGNGAILRSTDRGNSFQRSDLPFGLGANEAGRGNGERLAVDPHDGRMLLLGTRGQGLWQSRDHGAHWQRLESFPIPDNTDDGGQAIGVVLVRFDPASGRPGQPTPVVYVGVSTTQTSLFRSDDAGASWQAVPGQPTGLRPNHMARASNGDFVLSYADHAGPNVMTDGAVWKYAPATGEWRDITPTPQDSDLQRDGFGWGAVAVDPQNPQRLLAATFGRWAPRDEIYRSTDGGASWTAVLARSQFDHANAVWTAETTPHWIADIEIDPFDASHVLFVTGYGIWATHDMVSSFDAGGPAHWRFDDDGLEETVPLALLSPPQGAPLISGVGDIDGFRHDQLDVAPPMFAGPRYSNTESLDYAGAHPGILVRSGQQHNPAASTVRAALSRDGGRHWQALASEPPASQGAGPITVSADGHSVIWRPRGSGNARTTDAGAHWQAVAGLPQTALVQADRFDPRRFHAFDAASGKLFRSQDGGASFSEFRATDTPGAPGMPGGGSYRPQIVASPERADLVYIAAAWQGLWRWQGERLSAIKGVDAVNLIALGKARREGAPMALYIAGQVAGAYGLFRSDDDGQHWLRIDDPGHRYGRLRSLAADPRQWGRVYLGTEGRGIIVGDPA